MPRRMSRSPSLLALINADLFTGFGLDIFPPYDTTCKKTKIVDGQCYDKYWGGSGKSTMVPDRELVCEYFRRSKCRGDERYSESNFADYQIYSDEDKSRLKGKMIGKLYGIKWPCCESFNTEWGIKWRVARDADSPGSYRCWTARKQVGLVTT